MPGLLSAVRGFGADARGQLGLHSVPPAYNGANLELITQIDDQIVFFLLQEAYKSILKIANI